MVRVGLVALLLLAFAGCSSIPDKPQTANAWRVVEFANGDWRSPEHIAANQYRHPWQTLAFFGLQPDWTVVEVWPGQGWYTEILAPYLREQGRIYVAGPPLRSQAVPDTLKRQRRTYGDKLNADPALYSGVQQTALGPKKYWWIAPAGSADLVLTFRDVGDWIYAGYAPHAFAAFYRALKPGGILGVVAYRTDANTDVASMMASGYITVAVVKKLAANAGFTFVAASAVNANGDDDHQHPLGPRTLPPALALGAQNRAEFIAIGAPDRMTLKFRK